MHWCDDGPCSGGLESKVREVMSVILKSKGGLARGFLGQSVRTSVRSYFIEK